MSWARVVAARLRGLLGYKRREHDLAEELRFHLDMQVEDNLKAGMQPEEARHAAMRSFGPMEAMKEEYREQTGFSLIETIAQDVRYAVRTLRKSVGFTLTSAATLALAIGVNTAMFSVLNALLLRPLPYQSPQQLTMLWTEIPSQSLREGRSAYWNIEQWQSQNRSFVDLAVFDGVSVTLTGSDKAERIGVARISPNFFPLIGVHPAQGRLFSAEEAEKRLRLAIISHQFWQTHFGGSPDALGASIQLDGLPSQIIGILPAGFQFPRLDADVWQPHTMFPDWELRRTVRGVDSWFVVGRLRANASVEQAQTEMSTIARRLDEQLPVADRNRGVSVVPLSLVAVGGKSRLALWMLTAAVCCILLIAASNVASLSLARSTGRARELAIRATLGASPGRIARQLLVESVTLAAAAGLLGALLAPALLRLLRSLGLGGVARLNEVSLDFRVLGWALAISSFAGILVGLAPAILMWRKNLRPFVQEGGRTVSSGVATRAIRRALVVAEFALAIVLLVGAGLLVRSWRNVESLDPGFKPERVLSMQLRTPVVMTSAQRANFYNRVLEQAAMVPGVESTGFISDLFISSNPEQIVTTDRAVSERLQFRRDEVSSGFFKTLGTPLLRGRFFTARDEPNAPRVAILNESMARHLWPGRDAIGEKFKLGRRESDGPWFTVVGIVGDMRRQGLEREPIPQMFESVAQNPSGSGSLLVRTSVDDPMKLSGTLESAVRRVEKYAPLYGAATLENGLDAFLTPRRFQTSLVIGFSAVGLLMAAIGIYGLIQYSIATRTQEIGVRIAVGAKADDIFRMIIGEGLKLSLTGLVLGLGGAWWVGRTATSLLFGVTATDPLTLLVVSLLLTAVAISACYLPARRAMKIEPMLALRQE